MKILTAQQVREWDAYTIVHKPIRSTDLMERAAAAAASVILEQPYGFSAYYVFCGKGNNGGDGLVMARLLHYAGRPVSVFILENNKPSDDFSINLARLQQLPVTITPIESEAGLPHMPQNTCLIDALFGTGLSRPLQGLAALVVSHINQQKAFVISIDMPSGLFADTPTEGDAIVHASLTLSFQCPKLAFFIAENESFVGKWQVLDIGLHPAYHPQPVANFEWVLPDHPFLQVKKYSRHDYKGRLGHVLLAAGSLEKMGAAIMCAKACLRSGNGLLTMAVPQPSFSAINITSPEAMCITQEPSAVQDFLNQTKINAVGGGPGWALDEAQVGLLETLMTVKVPLLLDASALYHLSNNWETLALRPAGSQTVITPHMGEFARLAGPSANGFERLQTAIEMAFKHNLHIVLKGAYTQVITPGGHVYFNSTGNPGMAKGGSGDVLTGVITSLLAQGYPVAQACVLGVYAHGLAGDFAASTNTQQAMTPIDIVEYLPKAWRQLMMKEA